MLHEIGADELPIELVINKIDAVDAAHRRRLSNRYPDALQVSALTGEGLDELRTRIADRFAERFESVRLLLPYEDGGKLNELYALGAPIEQREDTSEGVLVVARLPRREIRRFAPYLDQRRVIELPIQRLRDDAVVPTRAYEGDAGLDLAACERVELAPGERATVGTGLAVAIPDGYAGFVQPRSGLACGTGSRS